jgi:hypothetical protein
MDVESYDVRGPKNRKDPAEGFIEATFSAEIQNTNKNR